MTLGEELHLLWVRSPPYLIPFSPPRKDAGISEKWFCGGHCAQEASFVLHVSSHMVNYQFLTACNSLTICLPVESVCSVTVGAHTPA